MLWQDKTLKLCLHLSKLRICCSISIEGLESICRAARCRDSVLKLCVKLSSTGSRLAFGNDPSSTKTQEVQLGPTEKLIGRKNRGLWDQKSHWLGSIPPVGRI